MRLNLKSLRWIYALAVFIVTLTGVIALNPDSRLSLQVMARLGSVHAQAVLGYMYWNGTAGEKNRPLAIEWYIKAAEGGDTDTQAFVAYLYEQGDGVEKNPEKALELWRIAADKGNAYAQYCLGLSYDLGSNNLVESDVDAAYWYKKAARQGEERAQNNLAMLYLHGRGVEKNEEEALNLLRLAAGNGNAVAQNSLGNLYLHGKYVKVDLEESRKWFGKATEQYKNMAVLASSVYAQDNIYAGEEEFKPYAMDREQMLMDIQATKEKVKANEAGYNPIFSSKLALSLARYYIHSGQRERGLKEMDDVVRYFPASSIIQPYVGMALEDINSGKISSALAQLRNLEVIANKIRKVNEGLLENQGFGGPRKKEESVYSLAYPMCLEVQKALALKGDFDALEELATSTDCKRGYAPAYLPALIVSARYNRAFKWAVLQQKLFADDAEEGQVPISYHLRRAISEIRGCLPDASGPASSDEVQGLLDAQAGIAGNRDDGKNTLLSILLAQSHEYKAARQSARLVEDKELREESYRSILNHYVRINDRETVYEVAGEMGLFESPPELNSNGWGSKSPSQWNISPIKVAEEWIENPTDLVFELIDRLKNPQTKFAILKTLVVAAEKNDTIKVPRCNKTSAECLIDQMEAIADAQPDSSYQTKIDHPHAFVQAGVKDQMLSTLVYLLKARGDQAGAERLYKRISNPHSSSCHYDVCVPVASDPSGPPKLDVKSCLSLLNTPPDKYYPEALLQSNRNGYREIQNYSRCSVENRHYRKFILDPNNLGKVRDHFFKDILVNIGVNLDNLNDILNIIAVIENASSREGAASSAFRSYLKSSKADKNVERFEIYSRVLDAVLQHPILKNDSGVLRAAFEPLVIDDHTFNVDQGDSAMGRGVIARSFKEYPDVVNTLVSDAAYHGSLCRVMLDFLPKPALLAKVSDGDLEKSYRSCILGLIRDDKLPQALYLSANMFRSDEMKAVAEKEILDEIFYKENSAFAESEEKNDYFNPRWRPERNRQSKPSNCALYQQQY